jgi:hypothetical protein
MRDGFVQVVIELRVILEASRHCLALIHTVQRILEPCHCRSCLYYRRIQVFVERFIVQKHGRAFPLPYWPG